MITRAEAEEILAAFGPCSTLVETWSVDEVVAEVNGAASVRAFIEAQIAAEDAMGDRMAATAREREASGEPAYKDNHLKVVFDEVEFLKLIKDRVELLLQRRRW
jgi:phosphoserine phosphatase